tara:strand:+ start:452 stop:634 length:183 start_codon:yes stop_codon:yes gene_type:complete
MLVKLKEIDPSEGFVAKWNQIYKENESHLANIKDAFKNMAATYVASSNAIKTLDLVTATQ